MITTLSNLSWLAHSNLDNMTPATRVTLIILTSLLILLGLAGNCFVLLASLKYRAIDIDRISILLIENLAAADFLIIIIEFVPLLVTLIANDWVLGDIICSVQSYGKFLPFVAETLLIMAMACYRAHVVLHPPLVPIRVVWFYIVVVVAWLVPALNCLVIQVNKPTAHFSPPQLTCTISDVADTELDIWFVVWGGATAALPMIVTITANIILLVKVFYITRSMGEALPNRGAIVTILWVGLAFILSWAPTLAIWTVEALHLEVVPVWGVLFSRYCLTINVVSNPVIYVLSNRRFKLFVIQIWTERALS
ncbi:melatonin receptor type 1B-like [Bolinopsis microptera]|uniref:melatonin receptor type 1B-like n=1 Tax=Bolinopsis microptera TaxID=2820187 RepID=UPI003078AC2A